MRAVVDASIWVSAALSPHGGSARILEAVRHRRFELVTSAPLLEELGIAFLDRALERRSGLRWQDSEQLILLLHDRGEMVAVTPAVHGCRDPGDDKVIEAALKGRADCIVTGDKDLLEDPRVAEVLSPAGIIVLTIREFLAALDDEAASPQPDE